MKKIVFFLLTFSTFAQTQISGIVTDSETGNPIPYVNIWIENGVTGVTSEENGTFTLLVPSDKNLVFSAMGFQSQTVKSSEAKRIKMNPVIFTLDEILIEKPKNEISIEIGDSKKIRHTHLSGQTPWIFAKYFPYRDEYSKTKFIKNAIVFTKSDIKNATFKLRIFDVGPDGFPSNDLIKEDIIVSSKKGFQTHTVDLSKFKLAIPENGIIIGYEWMIIESNKHEQTYELDGKRTNEVSYHPSVVCNPVDLENTYKFMGGKWRRDQLIKYDGKYSDKVIEPAINLTLTN